MGADGNTRNGVARGGRLDACVKHGEQFGSSCNFFVCRGICVASVVCDGLGTDFGRFVGKLCCFTDFGVLVMGGG